MKKHVKKNRLFIYSLICALLCMPYLTGCGNASGQNENGQQAEGMNAAENATEVTAADGSNTGVGDIEAATGGESALAQETAENAQIDFASLREENPDIFAWIYIPGTQIDYPVLQSEEADDFYEYHNAYAENDDTGAVYIELANLTSMCDFNTVLHGKTGAEENGLFADLYRFANPDFFEDHEKLYIYLDGNVLTYEIFAAYERENTSLIRTYDFTYMAGCQQFLDDLYGVREMNRNIRDGWDDLTPYHFLITLTTQKEDNPDRQFVVIAALIDDAAGTIDRVVTE